MRLLWARVGVPYSPATGLPIEAQTVSQMVDRVMALPEGTRLYLLAPVVRGRKGEYRKELAEWQKAGFTRVRIDGEFYEIEDAPALDKKYKHDIEVVVDRIVVREGIETRLADSFETALKLAEGLAYLDPADADAPPRHGERARRASRGRCEAARRAAERRLKLDYAPPGRIVFSEKFACPVSGFTIAEIEPRLFSFNAPQGACPACDGLGEKLLFDEELVVPNDASSIKQGRGRALGQVEPALALLHAGAGQPRPRLRLRPRPPRGTSCPRRRSDVILHGTSGQPGHAALHRRPQDPTRSRSRSRACIGNLNRRMLQTESAWMREELSRYQIAPAVRDLRRRPPQARAARGQDRRRGHLACPPAAASPTRSPGSSTLDGQAHPAAARDRPRDPQGDQRAPRLPQQCRARLPQPRPHQRHAVAAARASASASPARSAPACRACSTCSTSRRSASTSATTTACSKPSSACATSATP